MKYSFTKLFFAFLILSTLTSNSLIAQDNKKSQDNTQLPIDLKSDSGSYDKIKGIAVYEGNVVVVQGSMNIKSDKLVIYLKNNQAERLVASSKKDKLVTFDYVDDEQKPIYGEALSAEYLVADKLVNLKNKAMVKQGLDVIRGETLSYKFEQQQIFGSNIKMIINPVQEK